MKTVNRSSEVESISAEDFGAALDVRDSVIWADLDVCPRLAPSHGAKLCTYKAWSSRLHPHRNYLKLPLSCCDMRRLLRFRMGCHSLPIEIGRHAGIAQQDHARVPSL